MYVRLDGSMGIKKRQNIVDRFNNPQVRKNILLIIIVNFNNYRVKTIYLC